MGGFFPFIVYSTCLVESESLHYPSLFSPSLHFSLSPFLSFLSTPPPPLNNVQPGGGRVLLTNVPNQPLLPMQHGLTGPNARAPTVFPQNVAVVPQPLHQQLLQNPTAAGLPAPPYFLPQQPQFPAAATQQPINLGMTNTTQLGAGSAPQQIPAGMHTLPHMMASVNTATGSMSQVPPTNTTAFRGVSVPTSRPPAQPAKRSRAIKIIDPSTNKEVSMSDSKPETKQPAPLDTSSISTPVSSGVTAPFNAPPTGHVTGNIAQDFKRMVLERNTTGAMNAQSAVTTTSVVQKPPPPNAIITDPNNKAEVGGVSNKIGVSESVSSSKPRFDVESAAQQPRSLLGSQPQTSATAPTVSEADQKKRDEFRQKVLESVNQTASAVDEAKATQEVEVKNGDQEAASIASQNVGEDQKEALLPLPTLPQAPSAPLTVSPDESSVKQVGESENSAPSEDKNVTLPSVPVTQPTTNGGEQVEAQSSEVQTDAQPVPVQPVQPEKPESDETSSKEVDDVSPPAPAPVPPSTEESVLEKLEGVPEKSSEEDNTQSIQVDDTGSQVIADSEAPPPATVAEQEVESEAVKPEEDSGEKLKEEQVESSQPPTTQETPEAEPPKPEEEEEEEEEEKEEEEEEREEEKPSTSKSEPEQKEEEPVKKAEAAVPSSAVLVSDSPAPSRKVKEEAPSTTVKGLPSDVEDAKRTEMHTPDDVESEAKVEESKLALADQQEALLSSETAAKEKVNVEPKEPLPPKQVQQDERSATKPIKQEKPVDEGKSSPPTKPKEVVKPAEQNVKPEKQDRPASAKPVAAVPASAQLAPGEHLLE